MDRKINTVIFYDPPTLRFFRKKCGKMYKNDKLSWFIVKGSLVLEKINAFAKIN